MGLLMFAIIAVVGVFGAMIRNGASLLLIVGVFGINRSHAMLSLNGLFGVGIGVLACLFAFGLTLPAVWHAFLAFGLIGLLTTFTTFISYGYNISQARAFGIALVNIAKSLSPPLSGFSPCSWLVRVPS